MTTKKAKEEFCRVFIDYGKGMNRASIVDRTIKLVNDICISPEIKDTEAYELLDSLARFQLLIATGDDLKKIQQNVYDMVMGNIELMMRDYDELFADA